MAFILHSVATLAELAGAALVPHLRPRPAFECTDTIDGVRCQIRRRPVPKSNRVNIAVSLACDPRFELTLRTERGSDRVAKALGLARELQTNDPLFDQQVYVGCDERVVDDWLDEDEQARSIVVQLLRDSPGENITVQSISCSGGLLTLSAQARPPTFGVVPADAGANLGARCIKALQTLRDRLQAYGAEKTDPAAFRDPYAPAVRTLAGLNGGFILLLFTALLALGFTSSVEATNGDHQLLGLTGKVSAVVLVLIGLGALRWLRGSSRRHTVLLPLLLSATLGTLASVYALLRELDRDFDRSSPQAYATRILHRWTTHSKHSTAYHLGVRDWHDSQRTLNLTVPASLYRRFDLGDPVTVWERSGYLGVPWIAALTPGDPPVRGND